MLWSDCPSSFLHTPSIRWSCKKLYKRPSQNQTCWSSKISAEQDGLNTSTLLIVSKLYSSMVACFENISAEGSRMWSPDSVTEFISALVITNERLQYFRGLTTSLQEEAKDIVQAVSEIKTLTSSLKQVRENVDSYHSRWFETVSKMCNEWELHHQCPGYVVVSVTEQAYQHPLSLNTLEEPSLFQFWTILFLSLRMFSSHQKTAFQGLCWYHQCW